MHFLFLIKHSFHFEEKTCFQIIVSWDVSLYEMEKTREIPKEKKMKQYILKTRPRIFKSPNSFLVYYLEIRILFLTRSLVFNKGDTRNDLHSICIPNENEQEWSIAIS